MAEKRLPEARQCDDQDSAQFGAVAVRSGKDRWGVMHPEHGGHWATDKEVADWPVGTFKGGK